MNVGSNQVQQIARRARVARMSQKGMSALEIAEELGCHESTVERDQKAIAESFFESNLNEYTAYIGKMLQTLDTAENLILRMVKDGKSVTVKEIRDKNDKLRAKHITTKALDAVYIEKLLTCVTVRGKILGLDLAADPLAKRKRMASKGDGEQQKDPARVLEIPDNGRVPQAG